MDFDNKILKYLKLDKLVENLVGYAETQVAILRLEVEEKLEKLTQNIIHFGLIAIFVMLFLMLISFAVANLLNQQLESSYLGFVIISIFYLILALWLLSDKNQKMVGRLFKKKDEDA